MLLIDSAEYIHDYTVKIGFNNGQSGLASLKGTIFSDPRQPFAPLRDEAVFKGFTLEHGTLVWLGEVDLAPEYLYFLAFREEPTLQNQFRIWGYLDSLGD